MHTRKIIKALEANGWTLLRVRGDHHIFGKEGNPHRVVVPHPRKDTPPGTLRDIERKAGIKF